jgi:hypothetical protein
MRITRVGCINRITTSSEVLCVPCLAYNDTMYRMSIMYNELSSRAAGFVWCYYNRYLLGISLLQQHHIRASRRVNLYFQDTNTD